MSASYVAAWVSSGVRIMMKSASSHAAATLITLRPASSALARERESSRRPTRTSTPESSRLSAWAWPWLPYPMMATFLSWMSWGFVSFSW